MTLPPAPPQRFPVPLAFLLGRRMGRETEAWAPIRTASEIAPLLLVVHLSIAVLVATMIAARVSPPAAVGWAAAITAVAVWVARRRMRARYPAAHEIMRAILVAPACEGALLATAWGAAPLLLATRPGGPGGGLALWTLLAVVMIATAAGVAPLLPGAAVFVIVLGLAMTAPLLWTGDHTAALGTGLFALLLLIASVTRARAMARLSASELALADRDETVSLLLREFEDARADWLWETDAQRRVVRASARFAHACGREPRDLDGMPLLRVLAGRAWEHGELPAALHELAARLNARKSFRDFALPVVVGGVQRWWELAASPRFDADGTFTGFRGVGSDVTEQRAVAERINRMARFDALTGLPNRLSVNETLARALAEAERRGRHAGFMMIDLDRFKAVNDTLGHPVGDRLLGRVSERLARLMTDNELIGRLGGDEFAVVVRDAGDDAQLERLADGIIDTLSRPYEVDHHTLHIGASVGIAISPRDGRTAETLIRSADLALYRSKDRGGGVFHSYEPQLYAHAEERRRLEMALRQALERGEFHLDYQPAVDARTGQLRGFEALLRWQHPDLGTVAPRRFVPIAEDARLIAPIGEWVLHTVCAEAAGWPDDIFVAVNVSPEQLHDRQFVAVVAASLAQSGLPPHRLELEVTENAFLRDGGGATRVLQQLLDLGVALSLDDFGTGYSSLAYLGRTRFSSIKIDRSFVAAAAEGAPAAIAIIRAVAALADSLGMATTAEGVETAAEARAMRELGCHRLQGFHSGRPAPADDARARAHDGRDVPRAAVAADHDAGCA